MKNAILRCSIILLLLLSVATAGNAGIFIKAKPKQAASVSVATAKPGRAEHPVQAILGHLFHHNSSPSQASTGDGYKGILAIAFGGSGLLMLGAALAGSAVGLILPAFLFGVAGIVFGAMRKNSNRGLGHAGLILGIVDVALILLFIIAVIVAIASFV